MPYPQEYNEEEQDELKEALEDELNFLQAEARNTNAIALALLKAKIKGKANSINRDALAKYLKEKIEDHTFEIDIEVEKDHVKDCRFDKVKVELPALVKQFVEEYDRGIFPELIE